MTAASPALKEWAVLVKALGEGRQIVLIRKGGIREETKDFRVRHDAFFLYPTYDHQRADLLKPAFHADLEAVLAEGVDSRQEVVIAYFARVTDTFETGDDAIVRALGPHYIFAENYAYERLHWRPRKPLEVMLLRVYRLPQVHHLPALPEYEGCKSWIELAAEIPAESMAPVLADDAYERLARPVRALFTASVPN
jgi:hypothetical protein